MPISKWSSEDGHSPLVIFLNTFGPLSKQVVNEIDKNTYPLSIAKRKFLLKPGCIPANLYFIVKGVFHGYIKEGGKQITTWIMEENEIIGSIRTMGTTNLCKEYLQALEDSQLVVLPIAFTEYIFEKFPETNFIGRRIWEYSYCSAEERAYICRIPSAEKKYNYFIKTNPGLVNRISLKYIASYLSMTQETLSRVRNRQK